MELGRRSTREAKGAGPDSLQAGAAVVTSLVFLALVGVIAAALSISAKSRLEQAAAIANGARAYYAAEAGLAATLAGLPAGLRYTGSLLGPDALPDTEDDGTLPYVATLAEFLGRTGAAVDLRVEDDGDEEPANRRSDANETIVVRAVGWGGGEGRRVLRAFVGRQGQPYDPAAVAVLDAAVQLGDDFTIDGSDHQLADGCATSSGGPARAGIALADPAALEALGALLELSGAERVRGAGGSPSLAPMRPVDARYFSDSAASATLEFPGGAITGTWGEIGSAVGGVVQGDASVEGLLEGYGALVVTGNLVIDGTLRFVGSLAVGGTLRVSPTGSLDMCGAIICGALANEGTLVARRSRAALLLADAELRSARLPRLLAVREEF